jgi:hypothetical protein
MHNIKSALMDQIRTYQQQLHDLKMRLGDREGELDTLRYGRWDAGVEIAARLCSALVIVHKAWLFVCLIACVIVNEQRHSLCKYVPLLGFHSLPLFLYTFCLCVRRRQLYAAQTELQRREQELATAAGSSSDSLGGNAANADAMQVNLQGAVASLRLCIANHESTISYHKTELVLAQGASSGIDTTPRRAR